MKNITKGHPIRRRDVVYEIPFNAIELDMLYEIVRHTVNSLPRPIERPDPGTWVHEVIELDKKLTTIFHKRRR